MLRLIKQRQPRETMDQHLVAYLTQKFGLRPLVREWRRNVITAITHFQDTDPEIYLFGKVLRYESAPLQLIRSADCYCSHSIVVKVYNLVSACFSVASLVRPPCLVQQYSSAAELS